MENHITPACAYFIADYVNDQIMRGKTIDKFTIMRALVAYYPDDLPDGEGDDVARLLNTGIYP